MILIEKKNKKKFNPPTTPLNAVKAKQRREDIDNHGKPTSFERKIHNPKPNYNRQRDRKITIEFDD